MTGAAGPIVLLTGASGFVGRATLAAFVNKGFRVRAATRRPVPGGGQTVDWRTVDLTEPAEWGGLLDGIAAVVHLAGQAEGRDEDSLMRINAEAAGRLAGVSARWGVPRFVYLSSVRVHGHAGYIDAVTSPQPADAYGRSKLAGEEAVLAAGGTRMGVTILRPPMVYGRDRGGMLAIMAKAARWRLPLPVGGLTNRRSMIFANNLADLLVHAAGEGREAGECRLPVSEGPPWTYAGLVNEFAAAYGRRASAPALPAAWLRMGLACVASPETVRRMMEDCIVDGMAAARRFSWEPPTSPQAALLSLLPGLTQSAA